MEKIASFKINHDTLVPGIYISRKDRNTVTYDLRFCRPNTEALRGESMHTIEHIMATYLRFSDHGDKIVYFGPMGCKTGFYLVTFDDMAEKEVVEAIKKGIRLVADFEGEIPGAARAECGNYKYHDLAQAKKDAARFLSQIEEWDETRLVYPQ